MLNKIGPMEIVLIIAVALLIFGPSKLPQLGKSVGESIREFKKSMKSVGDEIAADEKGETKKESETEKKA